MGRMVNVINQEVFFVHERESAPSWWRHIVLHFLDFVLVFPFSANGEVHFELKLFKSQPCCFNPLNRACLNVQITLHNILLTMNRKFKRY